MIGDMIRDKKVNLTVADLFIRARKINTSVFITQSYFPVQKDVRLNYAHSFIIQIPRKQELQQVTINHLFDTNQKYSINIYKLFTAQPHSFLMINTIVASDNHLRLKKESFRKNIKTNFAN